MVHFVLAFRRSAVRLETFETFADAHLTDARALRDRLRVEFRADPDVEVVLLGADSEETIRATHGRYFQSVFPPGT